MQKSILLYLLLIIEISVMAAPQDSLFTELKRAKSIQKASIYNDIAVHYQNNNWDSSITMARKALMYAQTYKLPKENSRAYNLIGLASIYKGDIKKADTYLDSAALNSKKHYPEVYIEILMNRGLIEEQHGIYEKALEFYQQASNLADSLDLESSRAKAFNNLGIVNKELNNYNEALDFFKKALSIKKKQNDQYGQAFLVNNIGTVYDLLGKTQEALDYYEQALNLNSQLGNEFAVGYIKHNIGIILKDLEQYQAAAQYFNQSMQMAKKYQDNVAVIYNYHHLGDLQLQTQNMGAAMKLAQKSLALAKKNKHSKAVSQNYSLISRIYAAKNNKSKALHYYKKYTNLKDSIFNTESQQRIEELQSAYEKDRMEKKLALLEKEKKLQKLALEKSRVKVSNRNLWLAIFLGGFLLILVFSILLIRQINQKKRTNKLLEQRNYEVNQQKEEIQVQRDYLSELNHKLESQKDEIETQKDEIEAQRNLATQQRDQIFEQKKWLTDNITYASRIQKALLPPKNNFETLLSDFFIFNRPQGIVGGDFYWIHNIGSKTVIASADSTGHGVTGGFMSVLGISLLNDIVIRQKYTHPGDILNRAKTQLIEMLHQTGADDDNKDGMDISIITFDKQSGKYEFAAANQTAYIINSGSQKFTELKGDKMPVSIFIENKKDFSTTTDYYQPSDTFYLFSDGYPDQFGGPNDRKYLYKNFKKLLQNNAALPMQVQLDNIATEFYQWKGNQIQVDDVLILGIKP